jgi:hypothetical protein
MAADLQSFQALRHPVQDDRIESPPIETTRMDDPHG